MKVPWKSKRCIVCLEAGEVCEEHLIPRALGGILTCDFLCRDCNSQFGSDVEASARFDPSILMAADNLREDMPELARQLIAGHRHRTTGQGPRVSGNVRDREFRVKSTKLNDGSLIRPTGEAAKAIATMLQREGYGRTIIEDAVAAFEGMPENQRISIAPGLEVIKWSSEGIEPDLSRSRILDPSLPAKIALEFLALCVGEAIYTDDRPLSDLRRILLKRQEWDERIIRIERLCSGKFRPFHGICNEENSEYAQIQIRLFGSLTYCVHLPCLRIDGPRHAYTHFLNSSKEALTIIGNNGPLSKG